MPLHPYAMLPNPLTLEKIVPPLERIESREQIPNEQECESLWDKYGMLDNIRAHSRKVAHICGVLAERAEELGFPVSVAECVAAGLLHDLAKTRCLLAGGSHAQLGSAWIVMETANYRLGQAALLHVHWPWPLPRDAAICSLPFFVMYADKRVRHDACVTLAERFEDLQHRYGFTEEARKGIEGTHRQALELERLLSTQLGWNLDEYSFD